MNSSQNHLVYQVRQAGGFGQPEGGPPDAAAGRESTQLGEMGEDQREYGQSTDSACHPAHGSRLDLILSL